MSTIRRLSRPVEADEALTQVQTANQLRHRDVAIANYRRCLQAGTRFDLQVGGWAQGGAVHTCSTWWAKDEVHVHV